MQRQQVEEAYRVLLGRDPETQEVIDFHMGVESQTQLVRNFMASSEARRRLAKTYDESTWFVQMNANIDVCGIIEANVNESRRPRPGYLVNFLGVTIPLNVFDALADRGGQLDVVPIPANFHADMAEWACALRAIELSKDSFTIIELGSGWGCWMINTGFPAKRRGLKIELIGIEGDAKHIAMCDETMKVNGIEPHEYHVVRGIAAAGSGYALFPIGKEGVEHWGFEPKFDVSEEDSAKAVESGDYERLKMQPLKDVIGDRPFINLIHMDIQGGEADLIHDTLDLLSEKVGYLLIGTHSRSLEGRCMDLMLDAGWVLEVERPAYFMLPDGKPVTIVDGVQGWRNPRFYP